MLNRPANIEEFSPICDDYALYRNQDMMGMEWEVLELIIAFVRATKPREVVEIGTWRGVTALAIAQTLVENTVGRLDTYEIDKELAHSGRQLLQGLPATCIPGDANDFIPRYMDNSVDMLICDGSNEPGARYRDLKLWWPKMKPKSLVFLHDALKGPDEYKETLEHSSNCRLVLWTPRGLSIIQKENF